MSERMIRAIMQAVVSTVCLVAGFGVLIFELGDPAIQKLAAGWVGAVLGSGSSELADQRAAGHRLRLGDAEEV